MNAFFLPLAFVIGAVVPLQAAINNQLKAVIGGSTVLAALVSFSVGCLALVGVGMLTGQKWASLAQLPRAEWWMFAGGFLGALFVFGSGPLKGFGVTTMLGIITSAYTAVEVSRGIATLIYGGRKKLKSIAI